MSALEHPLRLEAYEPPEVRGEGRDDVALLVATRHDRGLVHARFRELPRFLSAGDLLVVNVSATLAAALDVRLDGQALQLWLSTPMPDGSWLVELRTSDRRPFPRPPARARLDLPGGVHGELVARFAGSDRLSVARFELDEPLEDFLRRFGQPVRYAYVPEQWPLAAYQTVFAREPGSAEMPIAGRPFTAELVTELATGGILVTPVTLHTGVSSPERGEPPYPERFRVPAVTARLVNAVRGWNGRVIAGNYVQVVQYDEVQFTKTERVLRGMASTSARRRRRSPSFEPRVSRSRERARIDVWATSGPRHVVT